MDGVKNKKKKKKNDKISKDRIQRLEEINGWFWKKYNTKPSKKSVNVKPKTESTNNENSTNKKRPKESDYQKLGRKMSIQTSINTNKMFEENPELWHQYHDYRDFSFKGYDNQDEIPVNKIIAYLDKKKKHKLKILDLGCGRNSIKDAFKDNNKFTITGYDHVSYNNSIACDIRKLPEDDESVNVCVFSQSLMGSNWRDYLIEAKRVLGYNGEIIISESKERYQAIKETISELEFHIKIDDYSDTKRWFYIHAIKD